MSLLGKVKKIIEILTAVLSPYYLSIWYEEMVTTTLKNSLALA